MELGVIEGHPAPQENTLACLSTSVLQTRLMTFLGQLGGYQPKCLRPHVVGASLPVLPFV